MTVVALIPARYASSRFPGKPLAIIGGKPMIRLVYERSLAIPGVDSVHVATDSEAIAGAVRAFGGRVIMTSGNHPSGTDRLAEAARALGLGAGDVVLNVQGDQPALNPGHPALLAGALAADPGLSMATLAVPMADPAEAMDPNHVKVVFGEDGMALYFSRAPIPWPRDGGPGAYFKHVGLYGYRAGFLAEFVGWPRGRLEALESLEQLRALERGVGIKVLLAAGLSPEVDVPADVAKAEAALASGI
ncbi:MAG: 3-deoxy-manno-octulosonate cytidylyltransferase [Deltaproteobacteria bacterium]|jgi:3-deoxy-manno-octulosonate cytidylyltransferase (CMP-KDO synthetase)|nr:3-deoxy-manno-octulosonate cytidylyltransferase [Deltaproteobacteria bacterium]